MVEGKRGREEAKKGKSKREGKSAMDDVILFHVLCYLFSGRKCSFDWGKSVSPPIHPS